MNQKEGVFAAVLAVVGADLQTPILDHFTEKQYEDLYEILCSEFQAGTIEYRGGCPDPEKLRKYVKGLVNNWFRKDERLNGLPPGTKYQAKNPGSRQGVGDAELRNLKLLLERVTDPVGRQQVTEAIAKRTAHLEAAKRKVIDLAAIPEHLRQYVQQ